MNEVSGIGLQKVQQPACDRLRIEQVAERAEGLMRKLGALSCELSRVQGVHTGEVCMAAGDANRPARAGAIGTIEDFFDSMIETMDRMEDTLRHF